MDVRKKASSRGIHVLEQLASVFAIDKRVSPGTHNAFLRIAAHGSDRKCCSITDDSDDVWQPKEDKWPLSPAAAEGAAV